MYNRIVTHSDFDGIVCAAICGHIFNIDHYFFTGPRVIQESKIVITKKDIVCDLPPPRDCGLWFDHHKGNGDEIRTRGPGLNQIEGCFSLKPSCSRVVYDYFSRSFEIPSRFSRMVEEADEIDTFNYSSIEEWQKETPGKIIDWTLKLRDGDNLSRRRYMTELVDQLKIKSLNEVAQLPSVKTLYQKYQDNKQSMLDRIQKEAVFLDEDSEKELVILDMTRHKEQTRILKHLSYLQFPQSLGVLEINNLYEQKKRSNNLSFSMSLALKVDGKEHQKDVGKIMRQMRIGDGHRGAGAGVVFCRKRSEMEMRKEKVLKQIFSIWRSQSDGSMSKL